jgi:hypothetical protein
LTHNITNHRVGASVNMKGHSFRLIALYCYNCVKLLAVWQAGKIRLKFFIPSTKLHLSRLEPNQAKAKIPLKVLSIEQLGLPVR